MGDDQYKFGDAPGLPAVENKKRIARGQKQKVESRKTFYTVKDGKKLVVLTVKANGCYSTYMGNIYKMGNDIIALKKKSWKESGQWLEPHEVEERVNKLIEQMRG